MLGAPAPATPDVLRSKQDALHRKVAKAHAKLGAWCTKQKLHADAKRHFQVAAKLDPTNAAAKTALAGDLPADAPKDAKRAARSLAKRTAKLNKKLAKLWSGFAGWATKTKHTDAALAAWEQVLALNPAHTLAQRFVVEAGVRAIPFDQSELSAEQKKHPQTQRARRIFTASLPGALLKVQQRLRLGVKPGEVKVLFLWGGGNMAAVTRTGTPPARIRVYCDRWTAKKADPDLVTLVCHELVHALQAARMGHDEYGALPRWFREGIALHIADQGPGRVQWALDNHGQKVESFLNGLEVAQKQKNPEDYAEGYLAVRYLLSTLGPSGFDAFLRALHTKTPFDQAVKAATGKDRKAFEQAAHAFARQQAKSIAK